MNALGFYCGEPKWFEARRGLIVTSSKVHDAITPRKRGEGELAARRNLKLQMIAEEITGNTTEHFVTEAMQWGIDNESRARAEYEYRTGLSAEPLGIVLHPTNKHAAATTDGWIKEEGGILEIKCPETFTHLEYLAAAEIPIEYLNQIDWQMACCGPEIEWCDFVSYDPRIDNDALKMLIIRRERNQKRIEEMEDQVGQFLTELIQLFEQIKRGPTSLEDKLRASIRQNRGQYPDLEISDADVKEFA